MAITRLSNNDLLTPSKGQSVRGGAVVGPFFNAATGGTVTDVSNYNGTNETWRVHTFSTSGTFSVTSSNQPFRLLIVAGGGVGGTGVPNGSGGGGGAGGAWESTSFVIAPGSTSVTVGAGGAVDNGDYYPCGRNYGGDSAFGALTCGGGGTGGTGKWSGKKPSGGGCGGRSGTQANGSTGGSGSDDCAASAAGSGTSLSSNITGTSVTYAVGGGGAACGYNGATNANPGAGGGGVQPSGGPSSQAGRDGVVIVSYRIA